LFAITDWLGWSLVFISIASLSIIPIFWFMFADSPRADFTIGSASLALLVWSSVALGGFALARRNLVGMFLVSVIGIVLWAGGYWLGGTLWILGVFAIFGSPHLAALLEHSANGA